ncbi:MAG: methyltransferase family protein [Promethearchaeota archaeon]
MFEVYLYFHEESKLQDHEIYSVLRHPVYASLVLICMGGMLFQMTLYSIITFIFYYFLFNIHIHFVEEKELINRFGNSYKDYQKRVPAIFIRPKNWKIFFKYLLGKTH